MAAVGGYLSSFSGQEKKMPKTIWQIENSESTDDKENVCQNRCSNSFDFELVSSLLEKRPDNAASATPRTILNHGTISDESDIENCHHPSSARNSCVKNRLGSTNEDFCAKSSNHLLDSFLVEETHSHDVETPTKIVVDPLIEPASTVLMSPASTILTLKKGQRIKDGMILMLTGQVDRRKQLLLGAQVQNA